MTGRRCSGPALEAHRESCADALTLAELSVATGIPTEVLREIEGKTVVREADARTYLHGLLARCGSSDDYRWIEATEHWLRWLP